MRPIDVARLVLLAAVWRASFMFTRLIAPELGPVATADLRLAISSAALVGYLALTGRSLQWRGHWRSYLPIGAFNSGIPFFLFAFAAQTLPASYLVVFNATSPLFASLLGARFLGERLTSSKVAGTVLGLAGVVLIASAGPVHLDGPTLIAVLACLVAAFCYGIAGVLMKRRNSQPDYEIGATGSQVAAMLVVAPGFAVTGVPPMPSMTALASLFALALVSSSFAYLLYFRLVKDIGPSRALTVTFLSPAFGVLLGAVFLGEAVTGPMIAGGLLVLLGTGFVVRRSH